MAINLVHYRRLRPYLYHLTAQRNLSSIRLSGTLRCAGALLKDAELQRLDGLRRLDQLELQGGVLVRDQKPLSAGAIAFEDGWDLQRFVTHVNAHVFFWPGDASRPITAGMNHYARYAHEQPVILRFRVEAGILSQFRFCRYNSGAPRCSGGRKSPRGSQTYLSADQFQGSASDVKEVVAVEKFSFPPCAEIAASPLGPWRPYTDGP